MPVAKFEFKENSADKNGAVYTFNNLSTDAKSFNWDFGDGGKSTEEHPTHIFKKNGTFPVTLIAKGSGGIDTLQQNIKVTTLPIKKGKLFFWTAISDEGDLLVWIDENQIGKITTFHTGTVAPNCGTTGFTVELPEGEYTYYVRTQAKSYTAWLGRVTVDGNICKSIRIYR
jgi:PKD repeat protein